MAATSADQRPGAALAPDLVGGCPGLGGPLDGDVRGGGCYMRASLGGHGGLVVVADVVVVFGGVPTGAGDGCAGGFGGVVKVGAGAADADLVVFGVGDGGGDGGIYDGGGDKGQGWGEGWVD